MTSSHPDIWFSQVQIQIYVQAWFSLYDDLFSVTNPYDLKLTLKSAQSEHVGIIATIQHQQDLYLVFHKWDRRPDAYYTK